MDTYRIPDVNHRGTYGRWGFAEFTDNYEIRFDSAAKIGPAFDAMIAGVADES